MKGFLASEDVKQIVKLLSDVIQIENDPERRNTFFMDSVAAMIGATYWIWAVMSVDDKGMPCVRRLEYSKDLPTEVRTAVYHASYDREFAQLSEIRYQYIREQKHVTLYRRNLMTDEVFESTNVCRTHYRPAGIEDWVQSTYPLSADTVSGTGFFRVRNPERFTERERLILHVIMTQVEWFHRQSAGGPAHDKVIELTPRQRMVLLELLGGKSAKEIARNLGISVHTVNDHMKELHRVYNVSSRGELLSRFIAVPPHP